MVENEEDSGIRQGDNLPFCGFNKLQYGLERNEIPTNKSHRWKVKHKQQSD